VDIRALDDVALADDAVMRAYWELNQRAELFGREHAPFWGFEEFLGAFRSTDSGERQELFAAYDGDRMVANAVLWSFLLDNCDKAWFQLNVDVPERRHGIGRALAERLEQAARDDGRSLIMSDAKLPFDDRETHGYRRFAEACGYELSNYEVIRHLALPVPHEQIQEWVEEAAPHHEGYTIETFVDEVPDDVVESLCVLLGQLAVDAPSGAVDFEEEVVTSERYAEILATTSAMGRARYETVALTPDRQVVAHSTLVMPLTGSTNVTSGAHSCTASTAATSSAWPPRQSTSAPFRRPGVSSRLSSRRTARPTSSWSRSTSGWGSVRSRCQPSSSSASDQAGIRTRYAASVGTMRRRIHRASGPCRVRLR
jgi:predicted N-acetyltransferase YhbS